MTVAPETARLFRRIGADEWHVGSDTETMSWGNMAGASYTRTDLIPALEAAAYARGLEDAAKVADACALNKVAAAIRALGAKP